jgi:hypothetical protein
MVQANIGKDLSGRIVVSFPYDPSIVTKINTIEGRRWHPAEKHWSFPNTDSILENILKVFEGKEVHLDPALQTKLSLAKTNFPVIARDDVPKQSQENTPTKNASNHNFEDLRRELVYWKISIWKEVTLTKFECGGRFDLRPDVK